MYIVTCQDENYKVRLVTGCLNVAQSLARFAREVETFPIVTLTEGLDPKRTMWERDEAAKLVRAWHDSCNGSLD